MSPLHTGRPPAPHDLWSAWTVDLWTAASFATVCVLYAVGRHRRRVRRQSSRSDVLFVAGLGAAGLALLSPLDTVAAALASAHMVQHLLLVLVAAPLLAASRPAATLLAGTPTRVRRGIGRWRHRLRLRRPVTARARHPLPAFLVYVGTLWFWHASVPYQRALDHGYVHVLMHATFLGAGLLLWAALLDAAATPDAAAGGVLLAFAVSFQGAFLGALLTFADTAWYPGYAESTDRWGLTPVADQQLAGALMWVPGGLVHILAALALLVRWVTESDSEERFRPARTGP